MPLKSSTPQGINALTMGVEFALTIFAGMAIGFLIDRHLLDRWMFCAIFGGIAGFAIGLYRLIRMAMTIQKDAMDRGVGQLPPRPEDDEEGSP
jgi:F0F1-type ATP synthase assembly protein I